MMTPTVREVCAEVLGRATPSPKERERVVTLAEELENRVERAAKEAGVRAEVRVEGSVAKDTWLSGEPDIDIFIRVPTTMPPTAFRTTLLEVARKATEGYRRVERFAEHPYLEAVTDSIRVNIVPCYQTKPGEWISATDRTPFHTDYVKPRLDEALRGEIRLLKRFMKGTMTYGAEIKVGGFSGYLCELLVLSNDSFLNVLRVFADWGERRAIDYEGYYRGREAEAKKIFEEPLIVVDPVDRGRNAASAVRRERLDEFISAARAFLSRPSLTFFYPPETKALPTERLADAVKKRGSALVFVRFGRVKAVPDILWGQLYKTQRSLRKMIQRHGFGVIRDRAWSDEGNVNMLIFELEQRFLTPVRKHLGPPIGKRAECERFLQKHVASPNTVSGPRVEAGRWVVETRRRCVDVVDLLYERLRDGGRGAGVAELISKVIPNTLEVRVNEDISELYSASHEFAGFLTEYLEGRPKWLRETYA